MNLSREHKSSAGLAEAIKYSLLSREVLPFMLAHLQHLAQTVQTVKRRRDEKYSGTPYSSWEGTK